MSNPQYVEFKMMMDRQENLNLQDDFMQNLQPEQNDEIKD